MLLFSSEAVVEPFYNERGTLEWPRDAAHSSLPPWGVVS